MVTWELPLQVFLSALHASILIVPGAALEVYMEMQVFYLSASVTPTSMAFLNVQLWMGTQVNLDSKPPGQSFP